MNIVIIDYNTGNVGSIQNMLKRLGYKSEISHDHQVIADADKLILPGVGHFDYGMRALNKESLVPLLNKKVLEMKTPILGICLGVQLFTESSTEGVEKGLGWIKGNTVKFDLEKDLSKKLPHMGWNEVEVPDNSRLFTDMHKNPRFYFVHTYHLQPSNPEDVLAVANYSYDFAAGLERDNIVGVQFHPEKSHKYGKKILQNFVELY